MIDYDMPLLEHDIKEMRKKAMIVSDNEGNELVMYKNLIQETRPKKVAQDIK